MYLSPVDRGLGLDAISGGLVGAFIRVSGGDVMSGTHDYAGLTSGQMKLPAFVDFASDSLLTTLYVTPASQFLAGFVFDSQASSGAMTAFGSSIFNKFLQLQVTSTNATFTAQNGLRFSAGSDGTGSISLDAAGTGTITLTAGSTATGMTFDQTGGTPVYHFNSSNRPGSFRVNGDTVSFLLHANLTTDRVGIAISGAEARLHVFGDAIIVSGAIISGATLCRGNLMVTSGAVISGALTVSGNVGFNGQPSAAPPDYTVTSGTTNRSIDPPIETLSGLAQIVGTIIQDLIDVGIFS